jgi:hypothetical protein
VFRCLQGGRKKNFRFVISDERCEFEKVGTWKMLPPAALELFTHPRLRTVALGGQEITKKLRKDFKGEDFGCHACFALPNSSVVFLLQWM